MVTCNTCDENLGSIGFDCSYCSDILCKQHRKPESHNCPGLGENPPDGVGPVPPEYERGSEYEVRNPNEIEKERRRKKIEKERGQEPEEEIEKAIKHTGEGEVNSRWWYPPAAATIGVLGAFLLLLLGSIAPDLIGEYLFYAAIPFLFIASFGGMLSIVAYYFDTKAIQNSRINWSPKWWLYAIVSIVLSPLLTAPVYVIQRYRYVEKEINN